MLKPTRAFGRTWLCGAIVFTMLAASETALPADNMDLVSGTVMFTAGMPTGASPDAKMNQYALKINYFLNGKDATGGLGVATIPVPVIPVTAGLPMPTAAQVAAASAAKAKAIVDAVNGAKLPGVTAAIDPKTMAGMYPTGNFMQVLTPMGVKTVPVLAPAQFTTFTFTGVRQSVTADGKLGSPVFKSAINATSGKEVKGVNVTGEVGNGKADFKPSPPPSPGSMFKGAFNGTGPGTGMSTGLDASGNQSVVGFGFIDQTSSTPVDFIATFAPGSGMTDSDTLSTLAGLFNQAYASSGYTVSYDTGSDTLSIDQMLPANDALFEANSDTGLFFDSNAIVPEPASITSLALGGAMLLRRHRRAPHGQ